MNMEVEVFCNGFVEIEDDLPAMFVIKHPDTSETKLSQGIVEEILRVIKAMDKLSGYTKYQIT